MKTKLFLMLLMVSSIAFSQNVTIPDAAFKSALVNDFSINTNMDSQIQVTEAIAYSGQINVSGLGISNLIGIEEFVNITSLNFENNSVSSVDLTSNIAIITLDMDNNNIVLTDLSALTSLQFLYASQNPWDYLDVSSSSQLFALEAKNSPTMSSLNVANGNNPGLFLFDVTNNPNLSCIQADASTVNTPPSGWLKDVTATYNLNCPVFCIIDIPDVSFKNFLLSFPHDLNNDGEIQCDEALLFTGDLNIPTNGITDLTGIEALVNIVRVTCFNNPISGTVDFSPLSQLVQIRLINSNVNTVIMGSHPSLANIDIYNGGISTIDLSGCPILSVLAINNNPLTSLDLTQNLSLTQLNISNTFLNSVDYSVNTNLLSINAINAGLTGSIDFSLNTALIGIRVTDNDITELNVANGNNINFSVFDARINPNLTCIEVDDRVYSQNNWTLIDPQTSFSEDCTAFACTINIPDANFKSELVNNSSINLNGDGEIQCIEASSYSGSISVGGKSIVDMTGIEDFVNITGLIAFANQIETLDLRSNIALTTLFVNNNLLLRLSVANGNNTAITTFNATSNPNLICIEVDDAVWSTTNWTNIDLASSFSEDCGYCLNTTTYTASGWSLGVPTNSSSVIIASNYDSSLVGASIDACEITINTGATLTIGAGDYLYVENNITVDGILNIQHEGSLVQVNDLATVTNSGTINVIKTTPVATGNSFSILGSPMSASTRGGAFVDNNVVMNHNTALFNLDPTVTAVNLGAEHFADAEGDNWSFIPASSPATQVSPAEGYLVGPTTAGVVNGSYDLTYNEGTLNNGVYTFTTIYNNVGTPAQNKSNSPNIMSNPYASAIAANMLIANNAVIDELYFWEHLTAPSNTYPGYRTENWDMGDISIRNSGGGLAAPNGGTVPSKYIASGQGFAVKINATGTVTFNNAMRFTGNNADYRNSETDRMYVSISNETYGLKGSTLVAFTTGASNGYEANYDTKRLATPLSIYSVLEEKELAIQGRSVFNEDQIIPIGFRTMVEEEQTYTISLGTLEGGNIINTTIYLQDNLLNTVTNLSEENYTFTSNESNQKDRFVIVFTEEQLGNSEVSLEAISIYPNPTESVLTISSPLSTITNIEVYDVQGRVIMTNKVDKQLGCQIDMSSFNSAVYFVKINTEMGSIIKRIVRE